MLICKLSKDFCTGFTTPEIHGFFSGARQVITFRPYVLLCLAFMFLSLAIAVSNIQRTSQSVAVSNVTYIVIVFFIEILSWYYRIDP